MGLWPPCGGGGALSSLWWGGWGYCVLLRSDCVESSFAYFLLLLVYLENKFAVGSGARCISICYFEKEHDWYAVVTWKACLFDIVICYIE